MHAKNLSVVAGGILSSSSINTDKLTVPINDFTKKFRRQKGNGTEN